jgi:hypothetical protein
MINPAKYALCKICRAFFSRKSNMKRVIKFQPFNLAIVWVFNSWHEIFNKSLSYYLLSTLLYEDGSSERRAA